MKRGGYGSRHFSWEGRHWNLFGDQSFHSIRFLPSVRVWWALPSRHRIITRDVEFTIPFELQLTIDFLFWSITGEYYVEAD